MSFVISGQKRFLVLLFYCVKRPHAAQSGQAHRPANAEVPQKALRALGGRARPRRYRLCRRFGDRVIGMTAIMAGSEQLDLLGELSLLR
jgi:hypothetical protein